jgi:hypothetical protein
MNLSNLSFLFLFSFGVQLHAQVCFIPADSFQVGKHPVSVTKADFNGDGYLDLATASPDSNNISVLIGTGTGHFAPAINYRITGCTPVSITSADFNNDGNIDLVTSELSAISGTSNYITVFTGVGNGTFNPITTSYIGANRGFRELISSDFNTDGNFDVAIAEYDGNSVAILLGTGLGTFNTATHFAVGNLPSALVSSDFNGDGKLDLAVANENSFNVSILNGTGNGSFGSATNFTVGPNPSSVVSADFNGDGYNDIATANGASPGSVSVLLGNGAGTFSTSATVQVGNWASGITACDFDSDGKIDLAVPLEDDNVVSVLMGTGTGNFTTTSYVAGAYPKWIINGDFNMDNKPDLVTVNYGSNNVSLLLGTGTGSFAPPYTNFTVEKSPLYVRSGDFNNDGIRDMVTSNYWTNDVSVFLGHSNGAPGPSVSYPAGIRPGIICIADYNMDGNSDLVVSTTTTQVTVLLGTGSGSFGSPVNYSTGVGSGVQAMVQGDFNNDGYWDIIAESAAGNLSFLPGLGNGTLGTAQVSNGISDFIVVGDFNGDGNLDLAGRSDSITIHLGTGTGTFNFYKRFIAYTGSGTITEMLCEDMNGDGKSDIVYSHTNGYGGVLLGNGAGDFNSPIYSYATGGGITAASLITLDVNQDLKKDLAVVTGGQDVSILLGTGTGSFGTAQKFSVGYNPSRISAGDYDNDGKIDMVVSNGSSNNLTILMNCTSSPLCVASMSDSLFNISPLHWGLVAHYSQQVTNVAWNWGDGSISTGLYPSHTYAAAGWYTICATVYTSCGDSATYCRNDSLYRTSSSMAYINVVSSATGKELLVVDKDLNIYPNPTGGKFKIQTTSGQKEMVHIYSIDGTRVLSSVSSEDGFVDASELAPGIYIIKTDGQMATQKLIIIQ